MGLLRCVVFLAVTFLAGCVPPPADQNVQGPLEPGAPPRVYLNGNAQFFGGGTWGH